MAEGVVPAFLSTGKMANLDFTILRPQFQQEQIDKCVDIAFTKSETGIPYNTFQLLNILFQKKLGYDVKQLGNSKDNICSVFAGITYGGLLPLTCYSYDKIGQDYLTPMDFIRFMDTSQIKIVG